MPGTAGIGSRAPQPSLQEEAYLREAEPEWAYRLAEALAAAGLPHVVRPPAEVREGKRVTLTLYVEASDLERARVIDLEILRDEVPDTDDLVYEFESDTCPSCGAHVVPQAARCGECELEFPEY